MPCLKLFMGRYTSHLERLRNQRAVLAMCLQESLLEARIAGDVKMSSSQPVYVY